jgi:glycerophosphoryl diester phosphodiesterase
MSGLLLLFIILNIIIAMIVSNKVVSEIQLISHRGGPEYHPENTLAAFEQAIDDGVDMLEFDVQMSSDGALVVFHDDDVSRITNKAGFIKDMTFEEIRVLDAGNGQLIPTFQEVITLANLTNTKILPEAKSPLNFPGIETAMISALVEANYLDNTIVQSFVESTVENFKQINVDVKICQLYGLWKLRVPNPQPGDAKNACVMAEMLLLNPWMIHNAHKNDVTVFVWPGVLDNPWMAKFVLALGADGLMSDDQLMLKEVLGR